METVQLKNSVSEGRLIAERCNELMWRGFCGFCNDLIIKNLNFLNMLSVLKCILPLLTYTGSTEI
jgi:hypothetical protein